MYNVQLAYGQKIDKYADNIQFTTVLYSNSRMVTNLNPCLLCLVDIGLSVWDRTDRTSVSVKIIIIAKSITLFPFKYSSYLLTLLDTNMQKSAATLKLTKQGTDHKVESLHQIQKYFMFYILYGLRMKIYVPVVCLKVVDRNTQYVISDYHLHPTEV